jgi:hypothetical protein
MLLTREDYFARSRDQSLPNRCPLLARCERRAQTIELVARQGGDDRHIEDVEQPSVPMVGEGPYFVGSPRAHVVGGLCPEVGLFEPSRSFPGFSGPTIRGQFDHYMDPRHEVLETGHFSECAEYAGEQGNLAPAEAPPPRRRPNEFVINTTIAVIGLVVAVVSAVAAILALR